MNIYVVCLLSLILVVPFVLFAVYSRRNTSARGMSVAGLFVAYPVFALVYITALGSPLNYGAVKLQPWRDPGQYQVLGSKVIVGEAIYVLIDTGAGEPLFLSLPFSKELADQLQKAMDQSGGADLQLGEGGKLPGAPTWNDKPQFLPIPLPPPLPPKLTPPSPPPVQLDGKSA